MILVEKHNIKKSNEFYKLIDAEAFKSKNLYNASLYNIRQHFFNTGKYLSCNINQKEMQNSNNTDYRALPSKVAQWTMKMVDQNFKTFFNSLNSYKKNPSKFRGKPKIPKYLDKDGRYLLTYTYQAISKKLLDKSSCIVPSGLDIRIPTKVKYSQLKQVRIVHRNDYYVVEVVYEVPDVKLKEDNGNYASIDLGVSNLATMTSNKKGLQPLIVDGRKLKSYNRYYNKRLAFLKSELDKRNQSKSSKQTRRLTNKRNNKVNDYLHKASRYIVNQLVDNDISLLIVGKNKGWKQDTNIGNANNQNFVQIPHYKFIEMLRYKCRLVGIDLIEQEESYTSKCSFLDSEDICKHETYKGKRIKRGLFKTSNGSLINADVNGSYNILKKCKPKAFADGVVAVVVQPVVVKATTNGSFNVLH